MPDTDFRLPAVTPDEALARTGAGAVLLDGRKLPARDVSGRTVRGAVLRDPFALGHDDPLTATEAPVVVFCVHAHEVSRFACALLRLQGREAAYVTGGFEALAAAGAPLESLR